VTDSPSPSSDIVRAADPDRYIADLFAPAEARPHLFALHAFAVEVAAIRSKVREPALGEIRLKWWEGALRGEHGGAPLAAELAETIKRFELPLVAFDNLLQASIFDLYDDPMPTLNDLEGYAGDTESALMQLTAMILAGGKDPGTSEVSGFAGVAVALTRLLRSVRRTAAGQSFLPADLMAKHGATIGPAAAGEATPAVRQVLADLRALARRRLAEARSVAASVDQALLPTFLPAAMVETYLSRLERGEGATAGDVSPLRRQWVLWRAARKGRF